MMVKEMNRDTRGFNEYGKDNDHNYSSYGDVGDVDG